MTVREVYLESAEVTATFVAHPAVAACWEAPSALAKMRVGALVAHLLGQLTQVPPVLDAPVSDPRVGLAEHWDRSTWTDGDLGSDVNTYIRRTASAEAAAGAQSLIADAVAALAEMQRRLPAEPADRVVQLPWGRWALTLDDYLTTRLLELTVHGDDLAVSVGVRPPALPAGCIDSAVAVLCGMAARRHGVAALVRALSRRERAPQSIAAL